VESEAIRRAARELTGGPADEDALLDLVGDARFVLLGEATHGTHEFYEVRARLTERLVRDKGFTAVAVEADWPDAARVHRFLDGRSTEDAAGALSGFRRFPRWMWRNAVVLDLVGRLRAHNASAARRVGFYGLDLYSLHASMDAVLGYLRRVDPEAARRARHRYSCFDHFGEDTQAYAWAARIGVSPSCEQEVVGQLVDLMRRAPEYASRDGRVAEDEYFFAEQNARLVRNAEEYYRSMFEGSVATWNLRDTHMADTLDALVAHLGRRGEVKVVVWAHNSHLGDARATEMGRRGELNLGQLVRERHPGESFHLGFTTATGTVTAATDWDGPAETKQVRPPLAGSWEELLHDTQLARFVVPTSSDGMDGERLQRAIGVIYRPETERLSHYFDARLRAQFDAVVHVDRTTAVAPLDAASVVEAGEEETYPTGL
jgi:erythromycin esterase-like protein